MPGLITMVAVQPGQRVEVGDVLLTIEAMKMETVLHAQKPGVVAEVLIHPAQSVNAGDLLMVLQS
jgi:pyruvate carboxylase